MDKQVRNNLRNMVTQARKLLEDALYERLEGRFGIHCEGAIEETSRMGHLNVFETAYRMELIIHLQHLEASGFSRSDALAQLVREIAFTHLNRLCAYKMCEERKLIRESVTRGINSRGFKFYLADHPADEYLWKEGRQDKAYRNFLVWLGGTLSSEIGILFSTDGPASHLFPPHHVLEKLLELINSEALNGIWKEDETIGWIYQYFTPKELRDQARKESQVPRNSYELAFRNQFFTPRYVVEFLVDNTLGRIWYEMCEGETALRGSCRYLVRRPVEIFIARDEDAPPEKEGKEELSQEELLRQPVYIPHRDIKDPRDLKILDPACGSGHFLLYCFDLLMQIYQEGYERESAPSFTGTGKTLKDDYPDREAFQKEIPGMILRHNLHGIDIDLRATQIASLALWLRAQRAYQEMELKGDDRPSITKSNIVCAEPMPGEEEMLEEFVTPLEPKILGHFVKQIFNKMKLAGEAGSLLKIEEELAEEIKKAKKEWSRAFTPAVMDRRGQLSLFTEAELDEIDDIKSKQMTIFDLSDVHDEEFWNRAEEQVLEALKRYAEESSKRPNCQKRLFAEDAARGFAFIDVLRKRYDVVVMNPPFGEFSKKYKNQAREEFPNSYNDIFAAFIDRSIKLLNANCVLGAITSRTGFFITSFKKWRENVLLDRVNVKAFIDLGSEILDTATVETAAYVIENNHSNQIIPFFRVLKFTDEQKKIKLINSIRNHINGIGDESYFLSRNRNFSRLSESPFVYWIPENIIRKLSQLEPFEPTLAKIRVGLQTGDDFRFVRALWEINVRDYLHLYYPSNCKEHYVKYNENNLTNEGKWAFHVKAGSSQPWFSPITLVVDWENNAYNLKNFKDENGKLKSVLRNIDFYFKPGFSWTTRAVRFIPHLIPKGCIPTVSRYMAFPKSDYILTALVMVASNCASSYMRFYGEKFEWPKFLVDNLKTLPVPHMKESLCEDFKKLVNNEIVNRREAYRNIEPFHEFTSPYMLQHFFCKDALSFNWKSLIGKQLEMAVAESYGLTDNEYSSLERDLFEAIECVYKRESQDISNEYTDNDSDNESDSENVIDINNHNIQETAISYIVGCIFGRWDVRIGRDSSLVPKLQSSIDPLPICPPGMLVNSKGLPATSGNIVSEEWLRARPDAISLPPEGSVKNPTIPDSEYPLQIDWDGILVDDEAHSDDVVRRVRDVLALLWKERAGDIEKEACEILGVKGLREYFAKPGKGGFFDDHIKRYSKSRRKAPIYWLLQSSKKNYSLWLYYHRLDKDMLFKALENYVRPKIQREENRLSELRQKKAALGDSGGREAKNLDKEIERGDAFLSELIDFREKLEKAAKLYLVPDLNDGVVLNIAPLWELVPWSEAKKYWDELMKGSYEWSSIGKQLREKGLVKEKQHR